MIARARFLSGNFGRRGGRTKQNNEPVALDRMGKTQISKELKKTRGSDKHKKKYFPMIK